VPDVDRIMTSLHSLTGLTKLRLVGNLNDEEFGFTSEQMTACLAHMPLLTCLHLLDTAGLDSLRFLSSGPITRSLKELELVDFYPQLPVLELEHVHALSMLNRLKLHSLFDCPLDEYIVRLCTPPSRLLPSLRHFDHRWEDSGSSDEEEEEEI
jgi:hypothetical protein